MGHMPTVQHLLEESLLSYDLKFAEVGNLDRQYCATPFCRQYFLVEAVPVGMESHGLQESPISLSSALSRA